MPDDHRQDRCGDHGHRRAGQVHDRGWGRTVGFASYLDRGSQRVFDHTEVDPKFGGRGLATILVERALEEARADGKRIVPVCSMVVTVLNKHPEYADITDTV
ncbi:hypothetical protein NIIDMKKI_76170 [Mycobacterium kansasii]|uniref:N-acetyltransferase domain-containing protein n=1 Tax=Mycobacterium kansasii TaxID=1768 RepID=A0A7G1IN51_MYCKA|nr:hypothetical protein NIIDMKKI_76170 [Mycobacterium kansasii]